MSFTLCTSGAIVAKAGKDVNSSAITSYALLTRYSEDAEGMICTTARYDFVTNYSNVTAAGSGAIYFLANLASDIAAEKLITHDMSGYIGITYAEDLINVLHNDAVRGLRMLDDRKFVQFLGGN